MSVRIRKGDFVLVIKGKDRGKKGRVIKVFPEQQRVLVEGINFVKRHVRPRRVDRQGGIVSMEKPVSLSNVQFFCMRCSKQTRIGLKLMADGSKARFCRKCGEIVETK
jgi:large subunit ribosomal protein L24